MREGKVTGDLGLQDEKGCVGGPGSKGGEIPRIV